MGVFGASTVHAQAKNSPFVLVHGAWHGGWCWRRVADRLTAKGRYVVAPTLSGAGERCHLISDAINLSTHVDDVVNEIKWKDLDGLSWSGTGTAGWSSPMLPSGVRERIAAIGESPQAHPAGDHDVVAAIHLDRPPRAIPERSVAVLASS